MDQKERMLAGLPYRPCGDRLAQEHKQCQARLYEFNSTHPHNGERLKELIKEILGKTGDKIWAEPPFRCDYGVNIEVGENFYSNFNCTILDVAKVTIGKNVMFAPNVSIYTAGHPIHPDSRNSGYEYGKPVTIGDNVWLGGNVVIVPGVTIGNNVVVGAGSVVVKDLPDNALAVGNPCRVLRFITEEDRKYFFGREVFDVEDYF